MRFPNLWIVAVGCSGSQVVLRTFRYQCIMDEFVDVALLHVFLVRVNVANSCMSSNRRVWSWRWEEYYRFDGNHLETVLFSWKNSVALVARCSREEWKEPWKDSKRFLLGFSRNAHGRKIYLMPRYGCCLRGFHWGSCSVSFVCLQNDFLAQW